MPHNEGRPEAPAQEQPASPEQAQGSAEQLQQVAESVNSGLLILSEALGQIDPESGQRMQAILQEFQSALGVGGEAEDAAQQTVGGGGSGPADAVGGPEGVVV